jgi:hypothetical protein
MTSARISRVWFTIPLIITIFSLSLPAHAQYSGGTGDPNDPYQIATAADLIALGESPEDYDKYFILTADIDLDPNLPGRKVFDRAVIAPDTDPVKDNCQGTRFMGVLDGNGHAIRNLTVVGTRYLGLFGDLGSKATVSNLGLEATHIRGTDYIGALAGYSYCGRLSGCYSTGEVTGKCCIGGLVGDYHGTALITHCFSAATVVGQDVVGGLVGLNLGVLTRCYSIGAVNGQCDVGGLVGSNNDGWVSRCYATGEVIGDSRVGGLVGSNGDRIQYCYATGGVTGNQQVGGLIGSNQNAVINCFSISLVTGGGLVGQNSGGVYSSFWDIETSGTTTSAGGVGKTTTDMKKTATYVGWGCEPEWTIEEGESYPRLLWESESGEPLKECAIWQGTGTEDDPFLIQTAEDLNAVAQMPHAWTKCFHLISNVYLSDFADEFNAIGTPTLPFRGTFNGNGHTISNLHLSRADTSYLGLFGYAAEGRIEHVRLTDPNVQGSACVGALVGTLSGGTVADCHVENGLITGSSQIGGLMGQNHGTVARCYVTGTVRGTNFVGGLVGHNNFATMTQCYSIARVDGNYCVGGLVGLDSGGTVSRCHSSSSVGGDLSIGGLVGSISTSYASYVGHCYSTSTVNGRESAGGLVGQGGLYCTSSCFWDIETSGQSTSAGGTGKTNAEMQRAKTFLDAGWDFVGENENGLHEVWQILEASGYPVLAMFNGYTPARLQGEGTQEAPYLISNVLELGAMIHYSPSAHYRLTASIDLSGTCWGMAVVPRFSGTFDGGDLTISHLTMEGEGQFLGLFGQLKYPGEVTDLGLIDVDITAGSRSTVGSMVGSCEGTLVRCYTTGLVVGGSDCTGGLVGYWADGDLSEGDRKGDLIDCYSTATVIDSEGACNGCAVGCIPTGMAREGGR